jgi:AcrR family transcriptional regulator
MSTYHHGDLRRALLAAAVDILETEGAEALSLREAARRAGVSHNAPYRHFADRDALLAGVAADGYRLLGEALTSRNERDMGEAYVGFALAHPQRFRLMFGGRIALDRHEALRQAADRAYGALLDAFRAGTGVRDPAVSAAAAWSLVHGLAHLLLDGHFADRTRAAFVRDVLASVRFV